ncbi:MAG TPA: enoyl-CoA hydratase [Acidimicrobiia bacterium]|nr:enoyl-CoA hydratase [Acidimicrobiia bacterium]
MAHRTRGACKRPAFDARKRQNEVVEPLVLIEQRDRVTWLTLNRPDRRNPLGLEMMEALIDALTTLPAESSAVVIAAAGPVFSAGHDLAEVLGGDESELEKIFARCTELMETVSRIPQPVIARVHGVATAAGCQLVAAADLAVAAESARFATPGVKIGLFCSTPMVPISRAIGRKRAMEMLLTGQMIDARTALDWGLVNRVVPDDQLDDAVSELVESIIAFSPAVIALGKRTFHSQMDVDQHQAYEETRAVMVANAQMDDAKEGIGAFLEKRPPTWRGR